MPQTSRKRDHPDESRAGTGSGIGRRGKRAGATGWGRHAWGRQGMMPLVLVAFGGAIGAVARVWLSGLVTRRLGGIFPWGTLLVNATGALAIGLLVALVPAPAGAWREAWLILVVGVLGSYTTVSSFSLQTLALARGGAMGQAAFNVLASLGLCLGAAFVGHLGAARLFGG